MTDETPDRQRDEYALDFEMLHRAAVAISADHHEDASQTAVFFGAVSDLLMDVVVKMRCDMCGMTRERCDLRTSRGLSACCPSCKAAGTHASRARAVAREYLHGRQPPPEHR